MSTGYQIHTPFGYFLKESRVVYCSRPQVQVLPGKATGCVTSAEGSGLLRASAGVIFFVYIRFGNAHLAEGHQAGVENLALVMGPEE